MTKFTPEVAEYNYNRGYWSLVERNDGDKCVFSTKYYNGDLRRSGWWETEEECLQYIGYDNGYSKEEFEELSKEDNWKLIKTINPLEVMPQDGFKKDEMVGIKENAEEICKKFGFITGNYMIKLIKIGKGKFVVYSGNNIILKDENGLFFIFPQQAVYPIYPEKPELEISKETFESARAIVEAKGYNLIKK